MIEKLVMNKGGKKRCRLQTYRCEKGHRFRLNQVGQWDDSFIEHVVYVYLRCLSLNTTLDIIRATYEEDILTKRTVLRFVEKVADELPTLDDIDRIFEPQRSGYLAFDGVWFKYQNEERVLLVCFDPETFDVVSAVWHEVENQAGYNKLINKVLKKIDKNLIKGTYGDGDKGLISSLKIHMPDVPFQLCVTHKQLRMGQIVPVKIVRRSRKMTAAVKKEILQFQKLFKKTVYAESKEKAYQALNKLKVFAHRIKGPNEKRFQKAYRSLKKNFKLTLTHFDHSGMARDNNLIECFNGCLKPRLKLMKSFKKGKNLNRYLKLFLLEFRFHPLKESALKERRRKTPLELGEVYLSKYWNFISFLRKRLGLSFQVSRTQN